MTRKNILLPLAILFFLLTAGQALAYTYTDISSFGRLYIGVGDKTDQTDPAALESDFFAMGVSHTTETFESFSAGDTPPLTLAIGTLTGNGYISDMSGVQIPTGEYAVGGSALFFSNGTPGDLQGKHTFTITLDAPQTMLGFYVTDPLDIGGIFDIAISGDSGSTTLHMKDILTPKPGSGELFYLALVADLAFDTLTFSTSCNDGYGIDNISTVAATPIPGAVWLLGSGLLGLVAIRRKIMS